MAASPQTAVLTAGVVKTFTFDEDFAEVEVAIIENPALVWFRADGADPVVMAAGCEVLPAALAFSSVRPRTTGPTVVKVVSPGTPTVSVRGVRS